MMSNDELRIRSFFGKRGLGNCHRVKALTEFDSQSLEYLALKSRQDPSDIQVGCLRRSDGIGLRCFQNGREIQFCGSGAAAAAEAALQWQFHASDDVFLIYLNRRKLEAQRCLNGVRIATRIVYDVRKADAHYYSTILGARVQSALRIGSDYCVLELQDSATLHALKPNLLKLSRCRGPSLIVTASARAESDEDYTMRYFAPQYGNPEDAATGSANFFLMRYWSKRTGRRILVGRQLSRAGGYFVGELQGTWVSLSAKTALLKS